MNECNNPIIIDLVPHFVLGNFMCCIWPEKAPEDRILAVIGCRKWSENLVNHGYSYGNGSMAFVLLAYHRITTIDASASIKDNRREKDF